MTRWLIVMLVIAACEQTETRRHGVAEAKADEATGDYRRLTTRRGPVHVWRSPSAGDGNALTVVYVHGHYVHVDEAWTEHRLRDQFAASGLPAVFIACEAPKSWDEPVSWPSLRPLLDLVERETGALPRRRVAVVGHSAAHRTVSGWLDEREVDMLVLVDSSYTDVRRYPAWLAASPSRRLIYVGDDTREWTDRLHRLLPESVVVESFPELGEHLLARAASASAVYVKSNVGHIELVRDGAALPVLLRMLNKAPEPQAMR